MAHAIRIHAYGGPEALVWERVETGRPGPGQALIRQRAAGLNYIDTYQRSGLYKLPSLPAILGMEGAGEVLEAGDGVSDLVPGDRVAYAGALGSYAEERLVPAGRLVKIPAEISFETAAAMMLRGMTVRYLFRETFKVGPGTVMLFHAAAGGVGLIACQWARHLGATLIGTAGSPAKAALARQMGAAHVIDYRSEDFVQRVREITGGKGCDVVYDSIGKDTFPGSLDCLKPKGLWVSFGNASGPVPPFELTALKGSLFATRPSLFAYTERREDLLANAGELFDLVLRGIIKIEINQRYALKDAAQAHREMESRKTTGSSILLV